MRARFVLSPILALGVGFGGGALADVGAAGMQPVRVALTAHAGCPDGDAFYREVRARTDRVRLATTDEEALTYRVTIRRVGDESVGELAVVDASRSGGVRTVRGETCAEVVAALAFIAALAVDPNAGSVASSSSPGSAEVPASMQPLPSARRRAAPRRASDVDARAGGASGREVARWRIEAGFGLEVRGLQAPDVVLATPLHVDFSHRSANDTGVLRAAFRLAISRASGGLLSTPVGYARLRWTTASIDACPLHVPASGRIGASACGGIEAGALEADGGGVKTPRSAVRGWFALRTLVRVTFTLLDSAVLDAQVGVAVPVLRDDFVFEPETAIYRSPSIVPFGGLALGARFP